MADNGYVNGFVFFRYIIGNTHTGPERLTAGTLRRVAVVYWNIQNRLRKSRPQSERP